MATNDIDLYNLRMRKSLYDKMFFVDKVDSDFFVDFGCADGSLIKAVHNMFPELRYVGYDNDSRQIGLAKKSFRRSKTVSFTTRLADVEERLKEAEAPTLIFSSVLHEMYSFLTKEGIASFWEWVFRQNFKYISIRDMGIHKNAVCGYTDVLVATVRDKCDVDIVQSFEDKWGSLDVLENLIHFLLKYQYLDNWENELKENYLAAKLEDYEYGIFPVDYNLVYQDSYVLPYFEEKIKRELGILLPINTHFKLIMRKGG